MNPAIFTYLKRKKLSDIRQVNRLFVSAYLRHHKLVPQVNQLLVDTYIDEESQDNALLRDLMYQLDKNECEYSLEDLTELFEFVISPEDRRVTGAVYTPLYIRQRIIKEILTDYDSNLEDVHIADIACGCGGFFLTVVMFLHSQTSRTFQEIIQENILGVDIQDYSIERAKLLMSLLALSFGEDVQLQFNLWTGDTLNFDFSKMGRVDIVVGNPPYVCVRNMSDESRELMKLWSVCASGNSDLYIPFFQIAIEIVRDGGRVGYITMNSFLTSLNGRALRTYFSEKSYRISIVDFRGIQMFRGRSTYTCLFLLWKIKSNEISYCVNESKELMPKFKFSSVLYSLLDNRNGWKLNAFDQTRIQESLGIRLGDFCQSRHGIATLSNKTYVFTPVYETENYFILSKNEHKFKIEKSICRKIVNPNKLNSYTNIDDIVENVIFPYFRNRFGNMEIIPEQVMKSQYPCAYMYLKSCQEELLKRDKGRTENYPTWYAYGRTQSLQMPRYKLFFPKIANKALRCELIDDNDLLLYNGMTFVNDDKSIVMILKAILESNIFWEYVKLNSKPYASGYYSLNGINIKNFGIPVFTEDEKHHFLALDRRCKINKWFESLYIRSLKK